jgi:hypothetical protein
MTADAAVPQPASGGVGLRRAEHGCSTGTHRDAYRRWSRSKPAADPDAEAAEPIPAPHPGGTSVSEAAATLLRGGGYEAATLDARAYVSRAERKR